MPSLSDIINIVISTTGAQLTTPAFNTPLILSTSARFTDRIRFYSSLTALEADGFIAGGGSTPEDPEHMLARKMLSGPVAISNFALGRLANLPTALYSVVCVNLIATHNYQLEIGLPGCTPTVVTYTSDGTPAQSEFLNGLKALIDALSLPITTTNVSNTNLLITMTTPGDALHVRSLDRTNVAVSETTADPGVAADLSAIQAVNGNFYAILSPFGSLAMGTAIATWVESRTKSYIADVSDTNAADVAITSGTDLGQYIQSHKFTRTLPMADSYTDEYLGASLVGQMFALDPGAGNTWAFKTLPGQVADTWSDAELTNLRARNMTYYATYAGRDVTFQGQVGSGEFFDTTPWGTDWLGSVISTNLATLFFNSDKVPYTQAGAAQIAAAIHQAFDLGVKRGFLASNPEPIVIVPDVTTIDANTKATRVLPNVVGQATLARAIHKTTLRVTLS